MSLQTRSEYSLCRLYTKSGCPRQFDRRPARTAPATAAGGGGSENPAPSSAAALPKGEQTGHKRKRAAPSDDPSSSSDGGGDVSTQQPLRLAQRGTDIYEGLIEDDMADWSQFFNDWI